MAIWNSPNIRDKKNIIRGTECTSSSTTISLTYSNTFLIRETNLTQSNLFSHEHKLITWKMYVVIVSMNGTEIISTAWENPFIALSTHWPLGDLSRILKASFRYWWLRYASSCYQQAVTWASVDPDLRPYMASLGCNELIKVVNDSYVMPVRYLAYLTEVFYFGSRDCC